MYQVKKIDECKSTSYKIILLLCLYMKKNGNIFFVPKYKKHMNTFNALIANFLLYVPLFIVKTINKINHTHW